MEGKMKKNRPKFRSVTLAWPKTAKDYEKFGPRLEAVLNDLHAQKYSLDYREQDRGMMIVGVAMDVEPEESAGLRLLRHLGVQVQQRPPSSAEDSAILSPRTRALLQEFMGAIPSTTDAANYPKSAKTVASRCVTGFSHEELMCAVDEMEKEAVAHEQAHPNSSCNVPLLLRAVGGAVRAVMAANLS